MWTYENKKEMVPRRTVEITEVGDMFVSFRPGIVKGRTGLMSLDSFSLPEWSKND
jgi:hypothetical protein